MAGPSVNPFLQSPYQAIIDRQDDEDAKPLPGSQAVKDAPLPSIPAAKDDDEEGDTAPAPAPAADPKSLLPPPALRPLFEATASHFKVPVNVLMALAQQESSYNPGAKNDSGASGMAQYLPATAKNLRINAEDPNEAIPAMAMQLRERLDKGYSMADAVKEHFAGPDRKLWGDKTAAYGDQVLAKAGQIGQELYGDDQSAAPAADAAPDTDTAQNQFAPTRMRRNDYLAEFKKLNPKASQGAIDAAMGQYDAQVAAAGAAHMAAKTVGPKAIPTPEQFFNDRLNERLQGPSNGIVPQLPGRMQPDQLQNVGMPDQPDMLDTIGGNAIGGMLGTIVGAVAANAHLVGADDVAKDWSEGLEQIKGRQKELGGDTFAGKTASLVGGIVPAMLSAPESKVIEFTKNSGLFGIPAFQETYKAKLAEGQSNKLALVHAFEAFGMNTIAPTIMQHGTGAIVGKLASEGAAGVKGAALGLGQAAGEGVGFSAANSVMDKGTDAAGALWDNKTGRNDFSGAENNNRPWFDPQDMAVQAAGFGAIRGAHIATHAAGSMMPDAAPEAAPTGPLSAAMNDAVANAASLKAQGASVKDQLLAIRGLEPDSTQQPAGPLDAAMQDAATQHAANPASMPEQPAEAPQPPDLTQVPIDQLRTQLKQVAQDAARNPEQRQALTAEQKRIRDEIKARGDAAMENSKPAAEPLGAGPFDDMNSANKMMQRYATETGKPHEVVAQGEQFVVKPMGEVGNGIDSAGNGRGADGHGPGSGSSGGVGSDNTGGRPRTGDGAIEGTAAGRNPPAKERADNAASDRVAANSTSHDAAAVANPYKVRQFPDQARAESFLGKQADGGQFEAVQTGPKRWQVQPRAAQDQTTVASKELLNVPERPQVPEEAQASSGEKAAPAAEAPAAGKAVTTLKTARVKHQKQEDAVAQAAANLEARKQQTTGGQRARDRVKAENPFMAFLGRHGVHIDERSDTGGQQGRAGMVMIPGYGSLYRHSGQRIDELAGLAHEAGFLSDHDMADPSDNGGTRKLADMIQRAAHNKEVIQPAVAVEKSAPDAEQLLHEEADRLGIDTHGKSADEVYDAVATHHAERFDDEQARAAVEMAQDADIPLDGGKPSHDLSDEDLDAIFGTASRDRGQDEGHTGQPSDASAAKTGRARESTASAEGSHGAEPGDGRSGQDDGFLTHYSADEIRAQQDSQDAHARDEAAATARADREAHDEQNRKEVNARMDASAEHFQLGQSADDSLSGQHTLYDIKDREEGDRREKPRGPDDRRTIEVDGVRRPIRDASGRLIAGGDFMKQMEFWRNFDGKLDEHGHPILGADDSRAVYDVGSLMRDNRAVTQSPRVAEDGRGADQVAGELRRARDAGEIDKATANFALWALDKSPSLARDLKLNVRDPGEIGAAGSYNSAQRIMNIFRGNENPGTAMHEILHHSERMMPAAIQGEILKAWQKAYDDAYAKGDAETRAALEDMKQMATSQDAARRVIAAFRDGTLKYGEHYQLSNPSEYWAVNATRLMAARHAADSWVAKAKNWLTELGQKVRGWLGLPSDAPILKALDSVLKGTGEQLSPKMLVEQIDGNAPELRDITAPREGDPEEPKYEGPGAKELYAVRTNRKTLMDTASKAWREVTMFTDPMGRGSLKAQRVASDYERALIKSNHQWNGLFRVLSKSFTPEQHRAMWEAGDEQNVLMQKGLPTEGKGIDRLPQDQREVSQLIHQYGNELLAHAKAEGMYEGEGLPYWTTRMAVQIGEDGDVSRLIASAAKQIRAPGSATDAIGFTKDASSLKHRKYLTTDETEAAAQAHADEGKQAVVVKDLRANILALARLEKAIAGRRLLNQIKAEGLITGEELVGGNGDNFVEVNHPAFVQWKPDMIKNADGEWEVSKNQNGEMNFQPTYLKIRKDWEGPLRAVLASEHDFKNLYKGYMRLKSESMNYNMASPLIHNMVILGRAAAYGKPVLTALHAYSVGRKLRTDYRAQEEMILRGMNPIGNHGFMQDITGLAAGESIDPGRSLTAKAVSGLIGAINKSAGDKTARAFDKAGDFWHGTLLWDLIGDLQRGLYVHMKTAKLREGLDEIAAGEFAGNFANRFAGSIRNSAMSAGARQLLNVMMFSRSFTVGNLGIVKDMIQGVPSDSYAQVYTRSGADQAARLVKAGRKEAISAFIKDYGLSIVTSNLMAAALIAWKDDDIKKGIKDVAAQYRDNYLRMLKMGGEHWSHWIDPWFIPDQLSLLSRNEPGKTDRIRSGTEADGTAIYTRNPSGKVPEEIRNWLTHPVDTLTSKLAPLPKSLWEGFTNKVGKYDQKLYPEKAAWYEKAMPIIKHVLASEVPAETIKAHWDILTGDESKQTNQGILSTPERQKAAGFWTGLTTSHGYPGGPEAGLEAEVNRDHREAVDLARPAIRDAIKHGDMQKAKELMKNAGMAPNEMGSMERRTVAPAAASMSKPAMKRFIQHATPDQVDQFRQLQQDK